MVGEKIVISYWAYPGLHNKPRQISITKLFNCIELIIGVTKDDLKSKGRYRDYVDSRCIFTHFLRKYTKLSLTAIGNHINRNHATVLHQQRMTQNLLEVDEDFKQKYESIEQMMLNPYVFNPDGTEDETTVGYNPKKKEKIKTVINK